MSNLTNILRNKYRDSDLDTAKIKAIDRVKGRISLSMRNGLTSTGTYLYDIADLREGMNVLVGNVNGSYVILNEIQNMPRLGTSYSVRRPSAGTFTITSSIIDNVEHGTISPLGEVTVNKGANQSFVITPNVGYEPFDVYVDGVNQGPITGYTFTNVQADHTISVGYAVIIGIRLNFEGVDGSIIFVDEATGIEPSYRNNCALSSNFSFDGTTSLKLNAGVVGETDDDSELKYHDYWGMYPGEPIPFPDTFKYGMSVLLPTTNMYGLDVYMWDGDWVSGAGIFFYSWYDEGSSSFLTNVDIYDREGAYITTVEHVPGFLVGVWNTFIFTAGSDYIEVKINGTVVMSEIGLISNPLSGMQDLYFWMSKNDDPVYIDKVYIRNL